MKYYYSGKESLWCGNWNHLVCRKKKCEVDHPSQSTAANLGKKQKWCSLWCHLSQVQQYTSIPDNFRILGCLWTIHHRCTCKWDWTEMLTDSFPLRAKTVWILLCMNTEKDRREEGQPWECQLSAGRLSRQTPRKYCQWGTRNILMMSSAEYLFLELECYFTKYVSSCPYTKYLYLRLPFLKNECVSDNTSKSVYQFLRRYGCKKHWKNQKTSCL